VKLFFFGTSSGKPTRSRNVAVAALSFANRSGWYLIDCGEGTQQQILRSPYSLHDLRAVFITHVHGDHCFGLPGLLGSAALGNRRAPLSIIAPRSLRELIEVSLRCTHLNLSFRWEFQDVEGRELVFKDHGVEVTRHVLSHRVPSYAYRFVEQGMKKRLDVSELVRRLVPRGPLWGRLQEGEDVRLENGETVRSGEVTLEKWPRRRVVMAGDNDSPGLLREACAEADLLVHEATFTEALRRSLPSDFGHCSAAEVARFAEAINLPNLVLTHFSARFRESGGARFPLSQLFEDARRYYGGNLLLARDLTGYRLGCDGILRQEMESSP